jgi:hypothetical protein
VRGRQSCSCIDRNYCSPAVMSASFQLFVLLKNSKSHIILKMFTSLLYIIRTSRMPLFICDNREEIINRLSYFI